MLNEEQENFDSTNEEELVDNEAEDESGTDTEEAEAEHESEAEAVSDDGDDERTQRAKAQRDRLAQEIKDLKAEKNRLKSEESNQENSQVATNSELVERTYLSANGITDKDAQNEVIRLAKKFDMSVDKALDDTDIKQRAESIVKKKAAQKQLAGGTGGASTSKKTPQYYADYVRKHGDFPAGTPNDMIARATDILAKE